MKKFYDSEKSNLQERVSSTGNSNEIHEDFLEYAGNIPIKYENITHWNGRWTCFERFYK